MRILPGYDQCNQVWYPARGHTLAWMFLKVRFLGDFISEGEGVRCRASHLKEPEKRYDICSPEPSKSGPNRVINIIGELMFFFFVSIVWS